MIKFPGISTCREHVNLSPSSPPVAPATRSFTTSVRPTPTPFYHPIHISHRHRSPASPASLNPTKTITTPLFLSSAYPRNHPLEQPARARVVEINCTRSAQQHRRVRASPTLSPTRHWHLRPRVYQPGWVWYAVYEERKGGCERTMFTGDQGLGR